MMVVWLGMVAGILTIGGAAKADFTLGAPVQIGPPIWSAGNDPQGSCFSGDGLELYFASDRPGGLGIGDIWVATREGLDAPWGEPINLGAPVNNAQSQIEPAISPDGLELYFGHWTDWDIRVSRRPSKDAPWSSPELLGPPVGLGGETCVKFSADGLSLYFASKRSGGYGNLDIWVSTRATTADPWGEPVNLGPNVNTPADDSAPSISSDGRVLFFISSRPGSYHPAGYDIWMTTRATTNDPWGTPINCDVINNNATLTGIWRVYPTVSPDGSVLYFERGYDMWQSAITPSVDFNGDGRIEVGDLVALINNWGTVDSLCDVGPMPWGDGKVDAADLEVLMSEWGQEVNDPTLVAHWALDETEGMIARDSASGYDGTLCGGPVWEPAGGHIDGALRCDGVDDYVATPFVLDRIEGSFSVFAWVSGGAPGQVILSQKDEVNWLMADAATGALLTELGSTGRQGQVLASQGLITEDTWHRVGFVRDGSDRILYVDDIEVARDTVTSLAESHGLLYIGAGKGLEPGTFWSGLIDDVRIYNRVVRP